MLSKSILLIGLSAFALADPIPQAMPTALPTDPAAISSYLASASALQTLLAGIPTLPASVESVLATAIPSDQLTATDLACAIATSTPGWYKSLPPDVKSAFTSWESAVASWYKVHSSELPSVDTSLAGAKCTAIASAQSTAAGAGKTTGTGTQTSTGTGTAATAAATSSTSQGGAAGARPTGAVAAGLAGAVGIFGLMIAL